MCTGNRREINISAWSVVGRHTFQTRGQFINCLARGDCVIGNDAVEFGFTFLGDQFQQLLQPLHARGASSYHLKLFSGCCSGREWPERRRE